MPVVSMKELLQSGVHFGHQTRRWNPKMKQYIFTERGGIYIIDLQKTSALIDEAHDFLRNIAERGGHVLFVGTKKQCQDSIKEEATRVGMPYVSTRWLGGLLTNFATLSKRIRRLHELRKLVEDGSIDVLPTREAMRMRGELEKLETNLSGVADMDRLPDAVFVIDPRKEAIVVREANKLRIPIVGLVDTNCDPDEIDYVIPGNDDAIRSCSLIVRVVADAVAQGKQKVAEAEFRAAMAEPAEKYEPSLADVLGGAEGEPRVTRVERPAQRTDRPAPRGDRPAPRADRPPLRTERPATRSERPPARGERPGGRRPERPVAPTERLAPRREAAPPAAKPVEKPAPPAEKAAEVAAAAAPAEKPTAEAKAVVAAEAAAVSDKPAAAEKAPKTKAAEAKADAVVAEELKAATEVAKAESAEEPKAAAEEAKAEVKPRSAEKASVKAAEEKAEAAERPAAKATPAKAEEKAEAVEKPAPKAKAKKASPADEAVTQPAEEATEAAVEGAAAPDAAEATADEPGEAAKAEDAPARKTRKK